MSRIAEVQKTVFNPESGEILSERKYRTKVKEGIVHFKPNNSFAKVFINKVPPYTKKIYHGYFSLLLHIMQKHSNILVVKKGRSLTTANATDIREYLELGESTFRRFITESNKYRIVLGLLTTAGYGYVINPAYAYNGAGIDVGLFMKFEHDRAFVESLNNKQIEDYNNETGSDYMYNIKINFPDLYESIMQKSIINTAVK